ncbi:hypothetical protein NPIL_387551 [Nephila pilipes]|uniref:Uncharacterized protein n=1 Tax=Nephila pilipes TaxID=299642 RepID=A0A8X6N3P4_NEPPI|nr:hypothetical protein NPIL_387551 [Nephila pilipes]
MVISRQWKAWPVDVHFRYGRLLKDGATITRSDISESSHATDDDDASFDTERVIRYGRHVIVIFLRFSSTAQSALSRSNSPRNIDHELPRTPGVISNSLLRVLRGHLMIF